jgi:primosomal protein N' (replication factor Y)
MIADVAFDVPVLHPFSYRVPPGWTLAPGQRVVASLRGAARVGMVIAVRDGDGERLQPLLRLADSAAALDLPRLELARWIAAQSLSSIGSTCAALLPPPSAGDPAGAEPVPPTPSVVPGAALPELLVGAGREARLVERIAATTAALVITPDVDAAARWARLLARLDRVARLDSGATDSERADAWRELARGTARLAVGTRSALLAPLTAGMTLGLVDEHEATHRPPGAPRIHSREVVLERAAREPVRAVLTAATPSAEMWWRADRGLVSRPEVAPAPWPAVDRADTRGILRREPLTPPLARAVRETLASGRRVFLHISRLTSSLACDECGAIARCPHCAIALAYSRAGRTLACRLCGTSVALMETCPVCRGRRLSPFGWGAERVEHAVRRRFPRARVARYDPEATRGARAEAQRAAAVAADVVIGTRGALRLFGPASLGLAGFVAPDQLLRRPDFRAGERMFALLWGAAERVRPDGAVIIQSQNPSHYAFEAVARQDLAGFYRDELKFRAELGYPPFRRLAVVSVGGAEAGRRLAADVVAALGSGSGLLVYPPAPAPRERVTRVVVKGDADLPRRLADALADFRGPRPRAHGIMEVEVDPVEWQS